MVRPALSFFNYSRQKKLKLPNNRTSTTSSHVKAIASPNQDNAIALMMKNQKATASLLPQPTQKRSPTPAQADMIASIRMSHDAIAFPPTHVKNDRTSVKSTTIADHFQEVLKSILYVEPEVHITPSGVCSYVWVEELSMTIK